MTPLMGQPGFNMPSRPLQEWLRLGENTAARLAAAADQMGHTLLPVGLAPLFTTPVHAIDSLTAL